MNETTIGERICGNPYVGRGLVAGKSQSGRFAVTAYFIMGRSENSRNRIFALEGDDLFTRPYDEKKVKDPSLIIYRAVARCGNDLIVTNGDQTDTLCEGLFAGKSMAEILKSRTFEPDAPNFTPRISAVLHFAKKFSYEISILKAANAEGSACDRFCFFYEPVNGTGHFIHTYRGDGDPLPSFSGEPETVLIPDDIDDFTRDLWENLNEDNKISLYVRYIDLESGKTTDRLLNKNR